MASLFWAYATPSFNIIIPNFNLLYCYSLISVYIQEYCTYMTYHCVWKKSSSMHTYADPGTVYDFQISHVAYAYSFWLSASYLSHFAEIW